MELETLVFATHNANKAAEIESMLAGKYKVLTLSEIGCKEEIPEDAPTLEGNAALKARYVSERYNVNVFADDTGLEVEALSGAPGVHTARYAGEDKDPAANMNKLLEELGSNPNRKAQFRTDICLIVDGVEHHFEGIAAGEITTAKRGDEGFGYDPVFQPEGYSITFAEMSKEEKNRISHRGKAVEQLIRFLANRK